MINRIADFFQPAPEAEAPTDDPTVSAAADERPEQSWIDSLVRTNPAVALAGAVAVGVVLAWLIKRR